VLCFAEGSVYHNMREAVWPSPTPCGSTQVTPMRKMLTMLPRDLAPTHHDNTVLLYKRPDTRRLLNHNEVHAALKKETSREGWLVGKRRASLRIVDGSGTLDQQIKVFRSSRCLVGPHGAGMVMMLFGPPGAGKGTHAPKIVSALQTPQLSTGDMLRAAVAAKTEVGMKASELMSTGKLVGDDIVIGIISERIKQDDCSDGFILDGFPRTLEQAKALDKLLTVSGESVSLVMAFDVDGSILEERICGRWMHKSSGRSYHVKYAPPRAMKLDANGKPIPSTMKDDQTGEPLFQRSDDTAEALSKRLKSYYGTTVPILDHYAPHGIVKKVDGGRSIGEVTNSVLAALKM